MRNIERMPICIWMPFHAHDWFIIYIIIIFMFSFCELLVPYAQLFYCDGFSFFMPFRWSSLGMVSATRVCAVLIFCFYLIPLDFVLRANIMTCLFTVYGASHFVQPNTSAAYKIKVKCILNA